MKYVVRTFIGMFLFAFCWVAIGYGIYHALQVGTCAEGGPYLITQPCPDGMERIFIAMMGGFILPFVAAGIYFTRGTPPGGPPPNNAGIILWFWTGLFWSAGIGSFLGVWGPEANPGPGGKEGGLIVGFLFAFMGAGGIGATWIGSRRERAKKKKPKTRLDRLDQLRQLGTLTDDEFETLRNKIVRED